MKRLEIKTDGSYQILIERGSLDFIGEYIKRISKCSKVCIVTDDNVASLYSERVVDSLRRVGLDTSIMVFPAGEKSKRLSTIEKMYAHFAKNLVSRGDIVVALGGGVTGDTAGFAASTYLRGIGYIQIPTTLLAQIDSSIGGKTGVDLSEGKNLVGAFHQPEFVLIDPDVLETLPKEYFISGMAEAIKYGCVKDKSLFEIIENKNISEQLEDIIYRCINVKKELIEEDEFDNGERMMLNFGHTIGHALENIYNYERLSHGQAVSIGMAIITKSSERMGLTQKGTYNRLISILKKYTLPISDKADLEQVFDASLLDKKVRDDNINIVLLKSIGEGFIHSIDKRQFKQFIAGGQIF